MTRQLIITEHAKKLQYGAFKGYYVGYLKMNYYTGDSKEVSTLFPMNPVYRLTRFDALLDAKQQHRDLP